MKQNQTKQKTVKYQLDCPESTIEDVLVENKYFYRLDHRWQKNLFSSVLGRDLLLT